MERKNQLKDPTEAFFEARFLEIYNSCVEKGKYDELWRYGVTFINNSFYTLANIETRETVAEMWRAGRLPNSLVDISGAVRGNGNVDGMAWQINMFLVIQAQKLNKYNKDGFKMFAEKLGIVDADKLKLFKLKDPRSWRERVAAKMDHLLREFSLSDLPPWI